MLMEAFSIRRYAKAASLSKASAVLTEPGRASAVAELAARTVAAGPGRVGCDPGELGRVGRSPAAGWPSSPI